MLLSGPSCLEDLSLVGDEVLVVGENDRSGAISEVELGKDMVYVGLHRAFADEEALGDLGVGAALADEGQYLAFAVGELVECTGRRRGGVGALR